MLGTGCVIIGYGGGGYISQLSLPAPVCVCVFRGASQTGLGRGLRVVTLTD